MANAKPSTAIKQDGPVREDNGEKRTQAERRAESDRQILRAATRLIAKRGAMSVSLAQIGLEAGYSRGLPAERFGTKVNLLNAVVTASDAWFRKWCLEPAIKDTTGVDRLRKRLKAHMVTIRDSTEPTMTLYQLMMDSIVAIPELKPRVQELNRQYRRDVSADLIEAVEAGEVWPDLDIDAHALQAVAAMHGVTVQWLIERDAFDMNEAIRRVLNQFADTIDLSNASSKIC